VSWGTAELVGEDQGEGVGRGPVSRSGEGCPFYSPCFDIFLPTFFPVECLCVPVCMSKSALHWPDAGCCTKSPVSPVQPGKVVGAQLGRLSFSRGMALCNAQTLQRRTYCTAACASRASPARAELKFLCWDMTMKSDIVIQRYPFGGSWWDGVNSRAGGQS